MALAQETNRILGVAGNLAAFDGYGGVANTNGPYDGQTLTLYWEAWPSANLVGYSLLGFYTGLSSDGQFQVNLFPRTVGTAVFVASDGATGWLSADSGSPRDYNNNIETNWTPSDGMSGSISWSDENGNPQTFDASALGGTGTATPILIDPAGNIQGAMSITLGDTNTQSVPAAIAGRIVWDNTAGHFYGDNGSSWQQLDN
jgi:hypothetical protein